MKLHSRWIKRRILRWPTVFLFCGLLLIGLSLTPWAEPILVAQQTPPDPAPADLPAEQATPEQSAKTGSGQVLSPTPETAPADPKQAQLILNVEQIKAKLLAQLGRSRLLTARRHILALPLVRTDGDPPHVVVKSLVDRTASSDAEEADPSAQSSPDLPVESIPATEADVAGPNSLPAATPDSALRTVRVPVLMYHYVSEPPQDADIYRLDLSVSPDLFAEHLDRMRAEGYTTISLYQLYRALVQEGELPPKPVVLTFDDGYRDNYINAFPQLRERNMTATFFLVTDFIDEERPEYLTWDMAREMLAGGMSIESHGRNHISLMDKDDDYLIWQALGSLETIQFELGVRPRFISYPAGEFDENTIRIFASADYWAGFTTEQGATHSSDNLFELQRVRIRGSTSADDLIALLKLNW
jgi:peptidoglycan/xylan/chitin deacetylase (PgdA/CDA1 family)